MSTTQTLAPGIHDMPADQYHADPCPVPSLSSGIAKVLVRRSPMHAHHAHPRFGGNGMEPTATMDAGSIMHGLILGKGGEYVAIEADDYRTRAAQARRDEIRASGMVPVLARVLDDLTRAADSALEQMRQHPDCAGFFAPGTSEAVLIANDGPTWLRCMVDRLPDDRALPWYDLKTTKMSAAPAEFQRAMIREHAFQRAFYMNIGRMLGLKPRQFLFIAIEQDAPHGVSVVTAAASLAKIADAEVERAVSLWRRCVSTNSWPGYPLATAHVEAPAWMLMDSDMTQHTEEFTA